MIELEKHTKKGCSEEQDHNVMIDVHDVKRRANRENRNQGEKP